MASIQFSDTSGKTGLVELLARATGTQDATTASYPIKQKTVDINDAVDEFLAIARKASPNIKVNDTNFTGEPLYSQNLTSGTQGYTFTVDSNSAQIQTIDRVDIENASGTVKRLKQLNPASIGLDPDDTTGLTAYQSTSGEPKEYRIVGKNVYLYPKPNYTTSSGTGLRLYCEVAPSYFVYTDTTKVAGINNTFHSYLWKRPAYLWLLMKKGANAASGMKAEMLDMESRIRDYFSKYNKDATRNKAAQRMTGMRHDTK